MSIAACISIVADFAMKVQIRHTRIVCVGWGTSEKAASPAKMIKSSTSEEVSLLRQSVQEKAERLEIRR